MKIFILVDAMGWEILKARKRPFLASVLPEFHPVKSVLGYSSACYPTIFSGKGASTNGLWGSYHRSEQSRFRWLRIFGRTLDWISWSSSLQGKFTRIIGALWRMRGYFNLYRIPLSRLPFFDVGEEKPLWAPGGIPGARSVFDHLRAERHPFEVIVEGSDQQRLDRLHELVRSKSGLRSVFMVLGELDLTMHIHGPGSAPAEALLDRYEESLVEIWKSAKEQDPESVLTLFSDHGMAPIRQHIDARSVIEGLPLREGRDMVSFYDSTMLRMWYFNDRAKQVVRDAICNTFGERLRLLGEDEKRELNVDFSDHRYGDDIFLVQECVEIVPSYMSRKGNAGMHGFHPTTPSSVAVFGTTKADLSRIPKSLFDLSNVFCETAGVAPLIASKSGKAA